MVDELDAEEVHYVEENFILREVLSGSGDVAVDAADLFESA